MSSTSTPRVRYVTIAEVADYLGVTPRSVRNYISKGLFPAYRIPGTRGVRLNLDEVNRKMRAVPATVARASASFGPGAKIIDLPPQPLRVEAYEPEGSNQ